MCNTSNEISEINFEDFRNQNGIIFWWASELMLMLGYEDMTSFRKVIDKATKAFISLGIDHYENIILTEREIDGQRMSDFKLTRFACYITAMNANPQKVEVARMQAYFAMQARAFEVYVQNNNDIDRLIIRDEIKEGNKSLSSAAYNAGVVDFAKFNNAGYRGKLFETMGRTELAANLFRITQTEERIKSKGIQGQEALERTHFDVGREVRKIVIGTRI